VLSLILIGYLIHWIPAGMKEKYRGIFSEMPVYAQALTAVVVVFVMYQLMSDEMQPFIYFQF
jgi:alginate O-acetyltransferase complex protein AlgI